MSAARANKECERKKACNADMVPATAFGRWCARVGGQVLEQACLAGSGEVCARGVCDFVCMPSRPALVRCLPNITVPAVTGGCLSAWLIMLRGDTCVRWHSAMHARGAARALGRCSVCCMSARASCRASLRGLAAGGGDGSSAPSLAVLPPPAPPALSLPPAPSPGAARPAGSPLHVAHASA